MRIQRSTSQRAVVAVAMIGLMGAAVAPIVAEARPNAVADVPREPSRQDVRNNRARSLTFGIQRYLTDHASRFPATLGATLSYHEKEDNTRDFLTPDDEAKSAIPNPVTAAWVDAHTSFVYLGNGDITVQKINAAHIPAYKLLLLHEKLEGREGKDVALAFLDGHSILVPFDAAKKLIDESKEDYAKLSDK